MKKVEKILDVIISIAVLVCLFVLVDSITSLGFGLTVTVIILSYAVLKVRYYKRLGMFSSNKYK